MGVNTFHSWPNCDKEMKTPQSFPFEEWKNTIVLTEI